VRAGRPRIVGSVGRLVQLCGDDCHGRFMVLRGFHLLAGRCVDLISFALPFGRLWYGEPHTTSKAIGYAKFYSRSRNAAVRVYDEAGNVIETHRQTDGGVWKVSTKKSYSAIQPRGPRVFEMRSRDPR
jgi:hypothetical protein